MATEAIIFEQIVDCNFDQAIYTASPNGTINVVQIAAAGSGTNIGLALTPKGTGYISAHVPDGTTTGGNARGTRSVDLQTSRTQAQRVASGANSSLIAGENCIASGQNSSCLASSGSQATGVGSVAIASTGSSATGSYSVAFGEVSQVSGTYAFGGGAYSFANAYCSFVFGVGARSNSGADNSISLGRSGTAHLRGQFVLGSEPIASDGDNQFCVVQYRGKTTNNTETELQIHGLSRFALRTSEIASGIVLIVGSKSDGSLVARYLRQVTLKRVGNTTSLVGSVITLGTDEAAGTSISITADDANDSLRVAVTGIASETWRWHAQFIGQELIFGS